MCSAMNNREATNKLLLATLMSKMRLFLGVETKGKTLEQLTENKVITR